MKRRWLVSTFIALFGASAVSFAFVSLGSPINVAVTSSSSLSTGQIATVIPYAGSQTVSVSNQPNQVSGLELYKVNLGNSSFSSHIHIQLFWTNSQEMEKVLHKGWVQVGVYYPDPNGSLTLPDGVTKVSLDTSTLAGLNPQNANVIFSPDVTNQTTLYILASVMNSANHMPPGQQVNGVLQFYAEVQK